jgi:SAM-dependent methyltransferase
VSGGVRGLLERARRRARWIGEDVRARLRGEPRIPTPPRDLIDGVGGGDYRAIGEEFFGHFVRLGGLRRDARVLDVGCGCGRMAVPLSKWLRGGRYDGFDVVEPAVEWCRRNVTTRFPEFRFVVADVRNRLYRPQGKTEPADWSFPYAAASFDFVFLTSVFTHMLPVEQERYVAEIARTLAPGGTCFATFFLWNDETAARIEQAPAGMRFRHAYDGYRAVYPDNHEAALAIPEAEMRSRFSRHGLEVVEPLHLGLWCRPAGTTFQDVVVARKPAGP